MKYATIYFFLCSILISSCNKSTSGPYNNHNLLSNSIFWEDGKPSLKGWIVEDTSVVHFSTDVPQNGSGSSIVMHAEWFGPWQSNSIYAAILPPLEGSHYYTLSAFGKNSGVSGSISVFLNRPSTPNSSLIKSLRINNSQTWFYYSQMDTVTTSSVDTLFVVINGGESESAGGTTYVNTCKFILKE